MPTTYISRQDRLRRQQAKQGTWKRRALQSGVVILLVFGIFKYIQSRNPVETTPVNTPTASATPKAPAAVQATANSSSSLHQDLQAIIAQHTDLDLAVSIINIQTGERTSINGTKPFTAASTTKIITACYYLHGVESGTYDLTDPLGNFDAGFQLEQLVNQSNNDSWNLFNNLLTLDAQQQYAKSLGLTSFDANQNLLDADDMALLLQKLYTGQLLNKENTNLLLSYMQNTEEERFIPAAVPSKDTVYHKIGLLDDNAHDAAIIDDKKSPFVLAIYSNGRGFQDYDTRAGIFHDLTKTVLSAY